MVDIAKFRPFFLPKYTKSHTNRVPQFHKIIQFVMVVVKTFIYSNIFSLSVVRSFCRSSNAISKLESPHHNVVVILVLFMW